MPDSADSRSLALSRRHLLMGASLGVGLVTIDALQSTHTAAAAPTWVKPLDRTISYTQNWVGNGRYPYEPDGKHRALDMQRVGLPANSAVYSMADGRVVQSGWQNYLGYTVTVAHADSYFTMYAHLLSSGRVRQGTTVSAGQRIGTMGSTGGSWPVHLHLEMYRYGTARHPVGGNRIDPESIVRSAPYPGERPPPPPEPEPEPEPETETENELASIPMLVQTADKSDTRVFVLMETGQLRHIGPTELSAYRRRAEALGYAEAEFNNLFVHRVAGIGALPGYTP